MTSTATTTKRTPSTLRRGIRRGFILWAIVSTAWLANSVRTQGVDPHVLQSSAAVTVLDGSTTLEFSPSAGNSDTALIFICGSGVTAEAYAPLLRPIAEAGYSVFVVRLPLRFAPLESHKQEAVRRAIGLIHDHPEISRWVVSGHSLGAALACRVVRSNSASVDGLVLVGTTHPKQDDFSGLQIPVTKVYALNDGIARPADVLSHKDLLPDRTRWVEITGGNHSQFGHYGHQLFDRTPTISRKQQQHIARSALMDAILNLDEDPVEQSHAPEPAAGSVSSGASSLPAR